MLRSRSPDMVRQEIYGYLLSHRALSALICKAATEAGIDLDRVKFKRTVRIVRRQAVDPAAFPPEHRDCILAKVMADITRKKNLNPRRRHRTFPRVVKRARQLLPGQETERHRHAACYSLRGLLVRNLEHLTAARFAKIMDILGGSRDGQEILAAWIGKEKLRDALSLRARITGSASPERAVRDRLFRFYD